MVKMSSVVESEVNAYFASLCSVAARVYGDVELVKQACLASGEWEQLSLEGVKVQFKVSTPDCLESD